MIKPIIALSMLAGVAYIPVATAWEDPTPSQVREMQKYNAEHPDIHPQAIPPTAPKADYPSTNRTEKVAPPHKPVPQKPHPGPTLPPPPPPPPPLPK